MESANGITQSELRVVQALQSGGSERWLSTEEVAELSAVSLRTARVYVTRLWGLEVVERADTRPARFRWHAKASKRNGPYVRRLTQAFEASGMTGEGQ